MKTKLNHEFDRHNGDFRCAHTLEFDVKRSEYPESLTEEEWQHEMETGAFTNRYMDECFAEIMRSKYRWLKDWSFAGRSNGWIALMIDCEPEEVRQSTLDRIESIMLKYFNNYASELEAYYAGYKKKKAD